MRPRNYIFLKDVLQLAFTAFGGPQAHISMMFQLLVDKRRYLTEKDLIELNALCQILPGPTSTQTITAIGFKIGGPNLAYLTLLIWLLPAATIMTVAALLITWLQANNLSLNFTQFIKPMAIGFVAYAAWKISSKVVDSKLGIILLILSSVLAYFFHSPWVFPALLLSGGAITAIQYKQQPIEENKTLQIQWSNFVLYTVVLVLAAMIGNFTRWLPMLLFENFYRNGSLVFGGGQVLIPLMYSEFVDFKHYLSSEEFLSGFAIMQALPGPVFAFCSYIGTLSMREYGVAGQILGAIMSTVGIFLPGTFLIFFIIRFWEDLKKYRVIKASLEGINAVSSGMVVAAAVLLYHSLQPNLVTPPLQTTLINLGIIIGTFCLLQFTKFPPPLLILAGLIAGFIF